MVVSTHSCMCNFENRGIIDRESTPNTDKKYLHIYIHNNNNNKNIIISIIK